MTPLHTRADGSYVVLLESGLPYHIPVGHPAYAEAAALDWSGVQPEPLPPMPDLPPDTTPPVTPVVREARLRAILIALGHSAQAVDAAMEEEG